jgi:deoxyribodipyrimidine photo-lyase
MNRAPSPGRGPAKPRVSIHWFRRDLRTADNHGLYRALQDHGAVLGLFIFDVEILSRLEDREDRRVDFIHRALTGLRYEIGEAGGGILVEHGQPLEAWRRVLEKFEVTAVTTNHDHEPRAIARDKAVGELLASRGIPFRTFKDTSVFERDEVMKGDGTPYTVFTPYSRRWRESWTPECVRPFPSARHLDRLWRSRSLPMPSLGDIGFRETDLDVPSHRLPVALLRHYPKTRDFPAVAGTSRLGVHLRFGTVSPRAIAARAREESDTFLNELIWREFFMQILWHHPRVERRPFRAEYEAVPWSRDDAAFAAWCEGCTGYPIVDAGMRELRATGFMHNRVRMVTASFLAKHLLVDWRLGEAWFARWLLDFELSSNNGNWQWAAGCGCDAAPYFRVFSPERQQEKFDPDGAYVRRWIPELGTTDYPQPIVDHAFARKRAIETYRKALESK